MQLSEEFTNRAKWFSNCEVMRQATSSNAELLAMSGPRKLGVIEEGAYANLLLVNGNPLGPTWAARGPHRLVGAVNPLVASPPRGGGCGAAPPSGGQDGDQAAVQIAEVHAYRGQADEALRWLERGPTARPCGLRRTSEMAAR